MEKDFREKGKRLRQMIEAADTICIIGHIRPDGDCVGSTLAIYNYIIDNYEGKTVDVYLEAFPVSMKFLNGAKKVKHEAAGKHYELAISMDVSDLERLGKYKDMYLSAISTICIDHHVSNPGFGDLCFVDAEASSACEALAELIDPDQMERVLEQFQGVVPGAVVDHDDLIVAEVQREQVAGVVHDRG